MARIRMTVSLDIPEGADRDDCVRYVYDAVTSWKGSLRPPGAYDPYDPGDPLYDLDWRSVEASHTTLANGKRTKHRCG